MYDYGNAPYEKDSGKTKTVTYSILELAEGGLLFDYVALTGKFSEPVARYFFKEFLNGLDHIHRSGFAHRDLKPENIMLDKDFNLKIVDFGFAAPINGYNKSGWLKSNVGTTNYMAPEIHKSEAYQGKSVDFFAAAIILFILTCEHPPFNSAEPQDAFYKLISSNRADLFWNIHLHKRKDGLNFLSKDLKELIHSLL